MKSMMNRQGFTLVELSLSLVFIGILSITAVLVINNTVMAYQRGLILNKINDVGMDLVDDMRAAVQGSSYEIKCGEPSGSDAECVSFVKTGKAEKRGEFTDSVPLYGGFCTGKYSYVWKSGYLSDDNGTVTTSGVSDFRLAKIKDDGKETICMKYKEDNNVKNFGDEEYEELLAKDSGLAIYDISVPFPAVSESAKAAYYSVSFVLGTKDGGVNILTSGDYCEPPEGINSNFNYCAINKFNFAAQTGGVSSGNN